MDENTLIRNLDKLHTTDLGMIRVKRNLSLGTTDVTNWCKNRIQNPDATITRRGKSWYIYAEDCVITVNAYSYTIITAHSTKKTR